MFRRFSRSFQKHSCFRREYPDAAVLFRDSRLSMHFVSVGNHVVSGQCKNPHDRVFIFGSALPDFERFFFVPFLIHFCFPLFGFDADTGILRDANQTL